MAGYSPKSLLPKKLNTLFPLGQPDNTNGLIGWYTGAGQSGQDWSGLNRTAVMGGSVTVAPPPVGIISPANAFFFPNSASTNNITIAATSSATITSFSLFAWVYLTAYPATTNGPLLAISGSTKQAYIAITSAGYPYMTCPTVGSIQQTTAIGLNKWRRLVGTWDGTSFRLYLNGAQVQIGAVAPSMGTLGALNIGLYSTNYFSTGYIVDARFYNRALSAAEISSDYYSALAPSMDGNMLAMKSGIATLFLYARSLAAGQSKASATGVIKAASTAKAGAASRGAATGVIRSIAASRAVITARGALKGVISAASKASAKASSASGLTGVIKAAAASRAASAARGAVLTGSFLFSGCAAALRATGRSAMTGVISAASSAMASTTARGGVVGSIVASARSAAVTTARAAAAGAIPLFVAAAAGFRTAARAVASSSVPGVIVTETAIYARTAIVNVYRFGVVVVDVVFGKKQGS